MTIGKRIKDFRKIRNMTQYDLADEIGVSVQAVSKWETDKSAPDISMLAPLSTVLGVSTDTLLGKTESGFDELKEIANTMYENPGAKVDLKFYRTVMDYAKRYPYDDKITNACLYAANTLIYRNKQGLLDFSQEELNEFFSVSEKSTKKIMESDLTMFQKCEAQCAFAQTCALMGYEEKTKLEMDKYDKDGWFRAKIENAVADIKTDSSENLQERFRCQCASTSYDIDLLLIDFLFTVRKMGSLGDSYAEKTIEAGKKILEVFDSLKGLLYEPHRIYVRLSVMRCLGERYAALGKVESALDLLEEIADYSEELIKVVREEKRTTLFDTSEFCGEDFREWKENENGFRERLCYNIIFWDIYDDKENNPIVTSPRYKAVVERIKGSKG